MEIKVTQNKVCIAGGEVHEGEFNVNPLHFTFSEEYTDNLVKKVVFSNLTNDLHYVETIINDNATIPTEVTADVGDVIMGVYAYEVDGENLLLRYSPAPVYLKVERGSYVENAEEGTILIPALTVEEYEQALNEIIEKWTIDSQAIIDNIVATSEAEFNTYYLGKIQDFVNFANEEEQRFTDEVEAFVDNKEDEFDDTVTTAKREIADMTTALTFATFDVDATTGTLYMNSEVSLGNMVFSVDGNDGALYVTI